MHSLYIFPGYEHITFFIEQEIKEIILERGWRYYKNGHVTGITELSPGEYEASVEGTEQYAVSFHILQNQMIDPVCTCPYDGPVCKHVAAVIFNYVKEMSDGTQPPEKQVMKIKSSEKKITKKKPVADQAIEILQQLSAGELQAFVTEQCKRNDTFSRAFLNQDSSKELFVKQLQSQLRTIKGRHGFIDYYHAHEVSVTGIEFLQTASSHFQQLRYSIAWHMACAALEVFTEALDYTDDSNGDVGICIDEASQIMLNVSKEKLPEELRQECFCYCADAYRKKLFSGWDWHHLQMDISIQLVNSKEEAAELHAMLNRVKPSGGDWDWDMCQAEVQRHLLISKTEGTEKANEYLWQNLQNSELRKIAIEQSIAAGNYSDAIRLAEQGIKKDEKNLPGLADEWKEYLLKIYRLTNDVENIIKYAFHLYVYSNRANEEELYLLIKKYFPSEKWEAMVRQIIHAIWKNEALGSEYRIAAIYVREQYWDELFGLVKQNPSLS